MQNSCTLSAWEVTHSMRDERLGWVFFLVFLHAWERLKHSRPVAASPAVPLIHWHSILHSLSSNVTNVSIMMMFSESLSYLRNRLNLNSQLPTWTQATNTSTPYLPPFSQPSSYHSHHQCTSKSRKQPQTMFLDKTWVQLPVIAAVVCAPGPGVLFFLFWSFYVLSVYHLSLVIYYDTLIHKRRRAVDCAWHVFFSLFIV